jgi:hypothetical protein
MPRIVVEREDKGKTTKRSEIKKNNRKIGFLI